MFFHAKNIHSILLTAAILLIQYPLWVSTFTRTSYAPTHFPVKTSTCNCVPVKDCPTLTTLMLNKPINERDTVYELVRNAACGFYHSDPLICCPTNYAHPDVTTEKDIWVWDSRSYSADDDKIHSRFATLNEDFNLKTNFVDFKDPETYKNNPQAFYENDEEYHGDGFLTQPYWPYNHAHGDHSSHESSHKHFDDFHYVDHKDDYPKYNFEVTTQPNHLKSPIVTSGNRRNNRPIIFPSKSNKPNNQRPTLQDTTFMTTIRNNRTRQPTTTEKVTTATTTLAGASTTAISTNNQSNSGNRRIRINSPNCGVSVGTRIIGGTDAQTGQFSWITRIGYINTTSNRISYRCSGSVITDQYILTAAHCVTNLVNNLKLSHILIGDMEITSSCRQDPNACNGPQTFKIADIIIHQNYDLPKYANDIALLRIERPPNSEVTYGTICLPLNNSAAVIKELTGKTGIVAGWSTNRDGVEKTNSPNVKYLQLPIVNTTECAINYAKYSENFRDPIVITPSQMCAQGQPMNDVCRGDSGGPFMDDGTSGLINTNGRYTLLGIVAFGPTICGASNFPGVYTRVSSYLDWIISNVS